MPNYRVTKQRLSADTEAHVTLSVATELDVANLAAGNQGGVALVIHDFQNRAVLDGLGDLLGENFLSFAGFDNDFAGVMANANLNFNGSPCVRSQGARRQPTVVRGEPPPCSVCTFYFSARVPPRCGMLRMYCLRLRAPG